jgi:hypothetical protein
MHMLNMGHELLTGAANAVLRYKHGVTQPKEVESMCSFQCVGGKLWLRKQSIVFFLCSQLFRRGDVVSSLPTLLKCMCGWVPQV